MSGEPEDRVRQLMHELAGSAPRPHDWEDLAVASDAAPESRGRGWLLAAAALVLVVGVAAVALVLAGRDEGTSTLEPADDLGPVATGAATTTVAITPAPTLPSAQPATTAPASTVAPTAPVAATAPPATTVAPTEPTAAATPTTTTPIVAGDQPVEAVRAYLADVAAGSFDAAAAKLAAGDDWEDRADLAPLTVVDEDELAGALAAWCSAGALCAAPATLAPDPSDADPAAVSAGYDVGGTTVMASFTVSTTGGVAGLPPLAGTASLAVIAEAADAETVVARRPDGHIITWSNGETADVGPIPADFVWSDGTFLLWQTSTEAPSGTFTTGATAATLDGTVVCEVDGNLHEVRQRDDGGYVASVERPEELTGTPEPERAVPNYAVDCADGTAEPIDPVTWIREGGSRSIERIGDHEFTFDGDAEGNADVINDEGVRVNGEDYAGYHDFSPDGRLVAYGYFPPGSVSALVTNHVRGRDAESGELLWSHDFGEMFGSLQHTGDRVLVALPPPATDTAEPWRETSSVVVLDARSGDVLFTIPTVLNLVHAS